MSFDPFAMIELWVVLAFGAAWLVLEWQGGGWIESGKSARMPQMPQILKHPPHTLCKKRMFPTKWSTLRVDVATATVEGHGNSRFRETADIRPGWLHLGDRT